MGMNKHEHFESHMDVSSPETKGDAEKIDIFFQDTFDDLFEERLSSFGTLQCKTESKTYGAPNMEQPKEIAELKLKGATPNPTSHSSTSKHFNGPPLNENLKFINIEGAFDALPESRRVDVYQLFERAPNEIKSIANSLSDELCVESTTGNDYSYYDLDDKKIRMEDQFDNSEYAEVFSHEYGHFVDEKLGDVSQTAKFKKAMTQDLESFDRNNKGGKEKFSKMLDDLKCSDAAYDRAVSDNLSAIFKNAPNVVKWYAKEGLAYYQHDNEDWEIDGNREAEIYANCFSMLAQNSVESCGFIKKFFPHTWEQFKQTLKGGLR